jgi:hypothetical protein
VPAAVRASLLKAGAKLRAEVGVLPSPTPANVLTSVCDLAIETEVWLIDSGPRRQRRFRRQSVYGRSRQRQSRSEVPAVRTDKLQRHGRHGSRQVSLKLFARSSRIATAERRTSDVSGFRPSLLISERLRASVGSPARAGADAMHSPFAVISTSSQNRRMIAQICTHDTRVT